MPAGPPGVFNRLCGPFWREVRMSATATTVEIPEHLRALREYLEQLLSQAADMAVAEERLETTAQGIEASELWTKGDTPMISAVIGAVEHAVNMAGDRGQTGLDIAQATDDAIAVVNLAISRCDEPVDGGAS
jgi:hypothetical protein